MSKEFSIDPKLADDPNYLAYIQAEVAGQFKDLQPGTLIAFMNGIMIATASSWEELVQQENMKNRTGAVFVEQVNMEKPIGTVGRGPRLANNKRK